MFRRLKRRIVAFVVISATLFTLILSAVALVLVNRSSLRAFWAAAEAAVSQRVEQSVLSIAAAQDATAQIVRHSAVLGALGNDRFSPAVNPVLNTLKNTSLGIMGLTLYTPSHTYTTSGLAAAPALDEIAREPGIAAFIASGAGSFVSVRTSHMAGVYQHVRYDPSFGMITYIVRLPEGFLFMDLNPRHIYRSFFDYRDHPSLSGVETFITTPSGDYLRSEWNSEAAAAYLAEAVAGAATRSRDGRYLIIARPFAAPGSQVVSVVPLAPHFRRMQGFVLLLAAYTTASILVAWWVGQRLSLAITTPLVQLQARMQRWSA